MEQPKLQVLPSEPEKRGKTTREKVKNTITEELFFGNLFTDRFNER